jgi:hypothetical protein
MKVICVKESGAELTLTLQNFFIVGWAMPTKNR